MKIDHVQRNLEEYTDAKESLSRFVYFNLNVVEVASYGLYALINISKAVKDTWKKELTIFKKNVTKFMKLINN